MSLMNVYPRRKLKANEKVLGILISFMGKWKAFGLDLFFFLHKMLLSGITVKSVFGNSFHHRMKTLFPRNVEILDLKKKNLVPSMYIDHVS